MENYIDYKYIKNCNYSIYGLSRWLMVKNHLPMQKMWVWSLGQESNLEKEMATHSSIFAWEITRTEEPSGLRMVHGVTKESDMTATNQQQFSL